jgi:amino acid transporter
LVQGWLTIFAWVTSVAATAAIIANIIISLAIFNYDDYVPQRWHTTLLMWMLIILVFIFNLFFRKLLNIFELIGGLCHFLFFFVIIISLSVLAMHSTPQFVFQDLTHGLSGWENPGVSWSLGLLAVTSALNGFDGVLHMSTKPHLFGTKCYMLIGKLGDEVKKVRTRVPRSIIIATVANAVMLFAFVICLLFSIGDINKVENTPTGLPLIEVFYEATKSKNATNFFVSMPAIVLFVTQFNIYASVSRLIWIFAVDKGLPFSRQFAYVSSLLN